MEKNGFKFKYSGGWGEWPEDYLAECLTIAYAKMEVMRHQKYRAEWEFHLPDNRSPEKRLADANAAKGMAANKKITDFMERKAQRQRTG
jgi:hypothetical protein